MEQEVHHNRSTHYLETLGVSLCNGLNTGWKSYLPKNPNKHDIVSWSVCLTVARNEDVP